MKFPTFIAAGLAAALATSPARADCALMRQSVERSYDLQVTLAVEAARYRMLMATLPGRRANVDGFVEKTTNETLTLLAEAMEDRAAKLQFLEQAGCT